MKLIKQLIILILTLTLLTYTVTWYTQIGLVWLGCWAVITWHGNVFLGRLTIFSTWCWYDLWIGAFYNRKTKVLYVVIVPTYVIGITIMEVPENRYYHCPECHSKMRLSEGEYQNMYFHPTCLSCSSQAELIQDKPSCLTRWHYK